MRTHSVRGCFGPSVCWLQLRRCFLFSQENLCFWLGAPGLLTLRLPPVWLWGRQQLSGLLLATAAWTKLKTDNNKAVLA